MKYLNIFILFFLVGFFCKADASSTITINKEVKCCIQSKIVSLQEILKRDSKINPEVKGFIIGAITSYQDVLKLLDKKDIKFIDYTPICFERFIDYPLDK